MLEITKSWMLQYYAFSLIAVFIIGVLTDYVWARWSSSVAKEKPFSAANWSFLTHVFSIVFTILIIENSSVQLGFHLAGCYFGAYLGVRKCMF